jgi:hypothetical protein
MKRRTLILSPLALLAVTLKAQETAKPECWCGLRDDDVMEIGEEVWKCKDRHVFSEPWEKAEEK